MPHHEEHEVGSLEEQTPGLDKAPETAEEAAEVFEEQEGDPEKK